MAQIKRGQIRYADIGENIGCRQGGVRPVVIVQNDIGNKYSPTTIVAPISSKIKGNYPFQVFLSKDKYNINTNSLVLCEQVITLDKQYILEFKDTLDEEDMRQIDDALKLSIGI